MCKAYSMVLFFSFLSSSLLSLLCLLFYRTRYYELYDQSLHYVSVDTKGIQRRCIGLSQKQRTQWLWRRCIGLYHRSNVYMSTKAMHGPITEATYTGLWSWCIGLSQKQRTRDWLYVTINNPCTSPCVKETEIPTDAIYFLPRIEYHM